MKKRDQQYIYAKLIKVKIKKRYQMCKSISELIGVKMKRRDQKYISISKLMEMIIKRGITWPIMIMIDMFSFFFI